MCLPDASSPHQKLTSDAFADRASQIVVRGMQDRFSAYLSCPQNVDVCCLGQQEVALTHGQPAVLDYKASHAALTDRAAVASVLLFHHDYRASLALLLCSRLRNKKKMQGC